MQKYLIAGLGNIGPEYLETRHNIGFKIVEEMAKQMESNFSPSNFGEIAQFKYKARPVTLLKPNTYMNLSGNAIDFWLKKEGIPIENLLVITDDLNLPFGQLRMRGKGSDGGHNGLKNIQAKLNTVNYARLRFGISNDYLKGQQIDYVLGNWTDDEKPLFDERVKTSTQAAFSFIFQGLNNAMNQFNGK